MSFGYYYDVPEPGVCACCGNPAADWEGTVCRVCEAGACGWCGAVEPPRDETGPPVVTVRVQGDRL